MENIVSFKNVDYFYVLRSFAFYTGKCDIFTDLKYVYIITAFFLGTENILTILELHGMYIHSSLTFHFDHNVACFYGRVHNKEPDFFFVRYLPFVSHDRLDSHVAKISIYFFR